MKAKGMLMAAFAILFFIMVSSVSAEDINYRLNPSAAIQDILKDNVGKRVVIKLDAAEELEGTVTLVGNNLVHISKLSRRDFYDAFVRIEKISAVILKARGN